MKNNELKEVLERHRKWLFHEDGGSRADLSGAYLSGANLSRADLSRAVYSWAQVAFIGHGECGRMLTAIILKKDEEPSFFCGCFNGSKDDLKEYIENGAAELRDSRTKAMEVVVELLNYPRP